MADNAKSTVQSVAKAFAVLHAFDQTLPELTITEVATRAGLDRGTSFRLINTLCQLGYLAPVPRSRRFRLTLKCLDLGYTPLARADLKLLSRPLLAEMVPDIADAASLGMLDGTDVVYIERVQDRLPQVLDRRVGSRTGAYSAALGHVLLAWLPEDRQRAILDASHRVKVSERTLTESADILARLAEVRATGYAVSDGENAYGLRTVAAPIFGIDGEPVAGISATIHTQREELAPFVERAVPRVCAVAADLTKAVSRTFGTIVPSTAPLTRSKVA